MISKVLRKTPFGKIIKKITPAFVKDECKTTLDEAVEILKKAYDDKGETCILKLARTNEITDEYDLDIIIPAYNVEKYVEQCIDSVLNQKTKYTYRVIIVEDGSTDSTKTIVDKYSNISNVMVIHQENIGLSGARNSGIAVARSKYIMFVDSDDYISENAVECLMNSAYENDAQIVEGSYQIVKAEAKEKVFYQKDGKVNAIFDLKGFAWGKVYKLELFKNLQFPVGYWYEDSITRQIIFPQTNNSFGVSDVVYFRRINPDGISFGGQTNPQSIQSMTITLQLFEERKFFGLKVDVDYYEYMLKMVILTYYRTCFLSEEIKKAVFVAFADFISNNFECFSSDKNKELEKALRTKNYKLYKICCEMTNV